MVQSAGGALRMRSVDIKAEISASLDALHKLLRFTQALITQMSQTAVCNRHHLLDQQLCRWLLLSLDRLEGNELVMAVRDTGPGLAPEHLPRLSERFYRVDRSRSRETGGTGLGLAITKHVAQRHGGVLRIESQPGLGSTFMLVLPLSRRIQRES